MSTPYYIAQPSTFAPNQKYGYSHIYPTNQPAQAFNYQPNNYTTPTNYGVQQKYRPPSSYVQVPVVYPQYLPPGSNIYQQNLNYKQPHYHQQQRNSVIYPNTSNTQLTDVELNILGEKLAAIIEDNGTDSPIKPHYELEEINSIPSSKISGPGSLISQDQLLASTPQQISTQNLPTSTTTQARRTGGGGFYNKVRGAGVSFPRGRHHQGHLRTGSEDVRIHQQEQSSVLGSSIIGSTVTANNNNTNLPHVSRHKRNASDGNPAKRRSRLPFVRRSPQGSRHSRLPSNGTGSSLLLVEEEPEPQKECSVCLTESPVSDFYTLACGHSFCLSCTNQHMSVLISSGITRLLCPQNGCGKEIGVEDIACVVDSSLIDKLIRFEKKKMIAGKKNARYCPGVDCGLPVLGDGENKLLICECSKKFCFDCSQDWHEGLSCKEAKKKLKKKESDKKDDRWKKKNTKPCPRCSIPIQKTAGCEFMHCGGCDFQFCWKCLEPHDHFTTTHKHGKRGRKKRIAKKVAIGGAVGVAFAVAAVPALLVGGIALPALIIGGAIVASTRKEK